MYANYSMIMSNLLCSKLGWPRGSVGPRNGDQDDRGRDGSPSRSFHS